MNNANHDEYDQRDRQAGRADDNSTARAQAASENVIHTDGSVTADEVEQGGGASNMPGTGTGGLGDAPVGAETRGDPSGAFGAPTGGVTGGKGITGMDVNSTGAGRADITGGGTASGLGGTSGGGTT